MYLVPVCCRNEPCASSPSRREPRLVRTKMSVAGILPGLEKHFEADCDLPLAVTLLGCDRSEGRRGRGHVGTAELNMVQRVEILQADLGVHFLAQADILEKRQVDVVYTIGAHSAEAGAESANVICQHLGGVAIEAGVGVKPSFGAPLGDGQHDVVQAAIEDRVAESESVAALAL